VVAAGMPAGAVGRFFRVEVNTYIGDETV
jgi:hypothetical protein